MQAFELAHAGGRPQKLPTLDLNVLDGLSQYVATSQFLHKLEAARAERPAAPAELHPHPLPGRPLQEEGAALLPNDAAALAADADSGSGSPASPASPLAELDDYVVLSREDAIEAMAWYIATHLSRVPEAQQLNPAELQAALNATFKTLRKSRFRQVWGWGTSLYRWSAFGYGAVQLTTNTWLLRAVCTAIWASSQMAFGFLWV